MSSWAIYPSSQDRGDLWGQNNVQSKSPLREIWIDCIWIYSISISYRYNFLVHTQYPQARSHENIQWSFSQLKSMEYEQ